MNKTVKIYSTPTCPWCMKAKKFLEDNKIEYQNIDVSSSQDAAQEMIRKSGQMSVPVFDIDGRIIVGFDKESLMSALGL